MQDPIRHHYLAERVRLKTGGVWTIAAAAPWKVDKPHFVSRTQRARDMDPGLPVCQKAVDHHNDMVRVRSSSQLDGQVHGIALPGRCDVFQRVG